MARRPYTNYGKAVGTALKFGYKAYRSYNKYTKSKNTNQNTVTTQYDTRLQYRKKRMPRWKRKAWKRFTKKVQAVNLKQLGTYTRVFNTQLENNIFSGQQAVLGAFLYSKAGKGDLVPKEAGLADLFTIIRQPLSPDDNFKFSFDTAVLDLTFKNNSSNGIEMDLYVVSFNEDTNQNSFQDAVITAEQETNTLNEATKALQLSDRGVTLFDLPVLISMLKMKIWSKRKYFIGAQQTMTYQYRDAKNHVVDAINVRNGKTNSSIQADGNGFVYPKLTKGVIMVMKQVPGSEGTSNVVCGVTRKYKYTQMENNVTLDAWNNDV